MASGGSAGKTLRSEQLASDRLSPLRSTPPPDQEDKRELELGPSELAACASPHLSRKTLDELGQENENTEDGDNFPLHSTWTFWFDRSPRGSSAVDYFANLRQICTVKTIKAFWRVFNNLKPVNCLGERESYHLMRNEGRRPVWEDLANSDGGLWSFKIRKEDTVMIWQEILLAAIGEQFSDCMAEGDDVCGVSVRIRGFDQNVIQIWNENSELHSKATVIQKVKELVPNLEINEYYQSNKTKVRDSLTKPHGSPYHRGISPPPPRYSGPMQPHFYPPPHPMYPPRPPPPHGMYPRYRPPPPHPHPPPYHPSRPPYPPP